MTALAAYLSAQHHIPVGRVAEILADAGRPHQGIAQRVPDSRLDAPPPAMTDPLH
ncbi:MAG: hypothetical protein M3Z75_23180 [Actinomycetota bacterium]|nr:hypothetical protein [Actinomycetota bacterium]